MNAQPEKSTAVRAIVTAWLVVGTLDIMSAIGIWLSRGTALTHGFQAIASGLLGAKSYHGGFATAGLGLAIHFFIALVVVAIYYAVSRKIRFMTEHAAVSGLLYGGIVYLVMYWIVLPTTFPAFRHRLGNEVLELAIHIVLIGLVTALIVARFSRPVEATP
jgi:hypothetical protein